MTTKTFLAQLTTSLDTEVLSPGLGESITSLVLRASVNGAGTVSAAIKDRSTGIVAQIWNGTSVSANSHITAAPFNLEPGDVLQAGHTGATEVGLILTFDLEDEGKHYALFACGQSPLGGINSNFGKYFYATDTYSDDGQNLYFGAANRRWLAGVGNKKQGIFGGGDDSTNSLNVVEKFDYFDNTITLGTTLNFATSGVSAAGNQSVGVFFGGQTGADLISSVQNYSYQNDLVADQPSLSSARSFTAAASNGTVSLIAGGDGGAGVNAVDAAQIYAFATNTLSTAASMSRNGNPSPRRYAGAASNKAIAFIVGGNGEGVNGGEIAPEDVFEYVYTTNTWASFGYLGRRQFYPNVTGTPEFALIASGSTPDVGGGYTITISSKVDYATRSSVDNRAYSASQFGSGCVSTNPGFSD